MVHILKPLAGAAGVAIFVIGITAAAISSQFPNIFVVPWVISDYKGEKVDMKSKTVRIIVICMAVLGIAVPLFHAKPIWVMVASQALNAILLPLTVGSIMYLANSKKLMGELKATTTQNLVFGVILIFALIMGGAGIYGLIN
jgi:Mn2+/Fe2+ NRAMP family transporter